jgi:hypothetical protein
MLPRLTAEESMLTRERLAVGTGALRKDDAQRIVKDWERQAHGGRRPKVKAAKANPEDLAAMGIAVTYA